jgi:hypothetical protein
MRVIGGLVQQLDRARSEVTIGGVTLGLQAGTSIGADIGPGTPVIALVHESGSERAVVRLAANAAPRYYRRGTPPADGPLDVEPPGSEAALAEALASHGTPARLFEHPDDARAWLGETAPGSDTTAPIWEKPGRDGGALP